MIDMPAQFRELVSYRTTLGHKTQHKFAEEVNSEFTVVKHPLFGVIVAILATEEIAEDEEVELKYNYIIIITIIIAGLR